LIRGRRRNGVGVATPGSAAARAAAVLAVLLAFPAAEDLGEREIEGVQCRGRRVARTDEVTDCWYSGELRQIILKETVRGEHWRQTYRLYNINLQEPDAALFLVGANSAGPS
ncbi:MAG: hypothetical protein ACREDR_15065, partial [Blastocatellia bacterium]